MSFFESLKFFMNSLMDSIYERELYINRKLIYID